MTRRYEQETEFRLRQGRFDFAEVALAVFDVAVSVKHAVSGWWAKVRPVVQAMVRRPHHLVLELDGIAQMPLSVF